MLFVITYDSTYPGCPVLLKGKLNNDWEWDEQDPNPDRFLVKNKYIFSCKNPKIDFDFWSDVSIASQSFVDLCKKFQANTRPIPLEIVFSNKNKANKKYFYLLWSDWLSIIDLNASEYTVAREIETDEYVYDQYFNETFHLETITKFVANEQKTSGKHVFKCIDLDGQVVCTDQFRKNCEDSKLVGLKFIPIDEFKKTPYWV